MDKFNFKIIVKQSDINKLDKEIKNGNVQTFMIDDVQMCILTEKEKVSIWPRHHMSYNAHKEGYIQMWEGDLKYFLPRFAELILDIAKNKKWLYNDGSIIYEIENDKT